MFSGNNHREFEWFEASFSKKLQNILDENNHDSVAWVRDMFISILLALFPIICEIFTSQTTKSAPSTTPSNSPTVVQITCAIVTGLSVVGLVIWVIYCIWRYNTTVKKLKRRILPHSNKGKLSIEESVHYFDNDVCNDIILSRYYLSLAKRESEAAAKEFYCIEALHYYYKSIRIFCQICSPEKHSALLELFTPTHSDTKKQIDVVRLVNYISLISSVQLDSSCFAEQEQLQEIATYDSSYEILRNEFNSVYSKLRNTIIPAQSHIHLPQNPTLISESIRALQK